MVMYTTYKHHGIVLLGTILLIATVIQYVEFKCTLLCERMLY